MRIVLPSLVIFSVFVSLGSAQPWVETGAGFPRNSVFEPVNQNPLTKSVVEEFDGFPRSPLNSPPFVSVKTKTAETKTAETENWFSHGNQGLLAGLASITPRSVEGETQDRQLYGRPGLLQLAPPVPREAEMDFQTLSSSQDLGPSVVYVQGYPASSHFNSTQPVSPILINPDQFWNRKQQPVVEVRNHALFGIDPAAACDEWEGYCGCCGLKANPGHLGIKCLRGNDPCECVECCAIRKRKADCCPTGNCR